MNESAGTFQLQEPVKPEALVPASWVEPWMFAVGGAILLAFLAALFFRRKIVAKPDPMAVRRAAFADALKTLEGINPAVQPREAAVQSSLIVRRYLSVAAGDPALFETHEEYLARHEALKDFSEEARASAAAGFTRLAELKYAEEIPATETATVIADSRKLLETLHYGFLK